MNEPLNRKLRMALIGGGGNAFIGRVHATAATLDRRAELVAGALSSDPAKARQSAPDFGISPERAYASYQQLIEVESGLPDDQQVDFVSIATPNNTHFAIARAALEAGFHVVCDKPMTIDVDEAESLCQLVSSSRSVFVLTHNYSGYPMVCEARQLVRRGELGKIQAVRVHYIQGGLRGLTPGVTPPRGAWKVDPEQVGPAGTTADLGTHAYHLLRYVTGLRPSEISCHMRTFHPVRPPLEDYVHALLRFNNDGLGMITLSQISHGRLNDLSLEVDGTEGSLSWRQEQPDHLLVRRFGQPDRVYHRNPFADYTSDLARAVMHLPAGHPEGFFESFANVYGAGFDDMVRVMAGQERDCRDTIYPNVHDGLEGVRFVMQCLASHGDGGSWKPLDSS